MDNYLTDLTLRENKWIGLLSIGGYGFMALSFILDALHEAFWWPPLAVSLSFLMSAQSRSHSLSSRIISYRLEKVEASLEELKKQQ